jgi:O-glycosyl hydrolase
MKNSKRILNNILSRLILLFCLLVFMGGSTQAQTLDLTDHYGQTIKGWGFFSYTRRITWWNEKWNVIYSPSGADAVFSDLNASIVRFNLVPQCYDGTASDKLDHRIIDELKDSIVMAKSKGISDYFLAVWSPPAEMKSPASTYGKAWVEISTGNIVKYFDGIFSNPKYKQEKTKLIADREDDYIEYVVNALIYLRDNGAGLPKAFSLQNEPGWCPTYDGTDYHYSQYQSMIKKFKIAFNKNGLNDVDLVFGDCNAASWLLWNSHLYLNYDFKNLDRDEELRNSIDVIASHTYDNHNDNLKGRLDQQKMAASGMWKKKKAYGYECYMSEWIPDRKSDVVDLTGIQYTIYEMEHVLRDLRVYPFEYYIWYTGWGVRNYTDGSKSDLLAWNVNSVTGELRKTKLYYIFQKLWGEVPYDGSYRVQYLTSSDPDIKAGKVNVAIDALAFAGDDKTVVVLINPSATAKTFTFSGLNNYSTGELFRTTSTQNMVSDGTVSISDGIASISLPGESINFLIASEPVTKDSLSLDTVPLLIAPTL